MKRRRNRSSKLCMTGNLIWLPFHNRLTGSFGVTIRIASNVIQHIINVENRVAPTFYDNQILLINMGHWINCIGTYGRAKTQRDTVGRLLVQALMHTFPSTNSDIRFSTLYFISDNKICRQSLFFSFFLLRYVCCEETGRMGEVADR